MAPSQKEPQSRSTRTGAVARFIDSCHITSAANRISVFLRALPLNVYGTFFLTFGAYSVASFFLLNALDSPVAHNISPVFGIFMCTVCIPMLFSGDTFSQAVISSAFFSVVCDYIGVRAHSFIIRDRKGHKNQGFAAGLIAGTLSLAFSTQTVIIALVSCSVIFVTMAYPMAGIMLISAVFPFVGSKFFIFPIILTGVSYTVKYIRSKRSVSFHPSNLLPTSFAVILFITTLLHSGDCTVNSLKYSVFILPFFLAPLVLRNCRDCIRAIYLLSLSVGLAAFLWCFSKLLNVVLLLLFPESPLDFSFFHNVVSGLSFFSCGSAPAIVSALIPVTAGLILRHDSNISSFIPVLSALCSVLYLSLTNNTFLIIISLFCSVFPVLISGRRIAAYSTAAAVILVPLYIIASGNYRVIMSYFAQKFAASLDTFCNSLQNFSSCGTWKLLFGAGACEFGKTECFYGDFLRSCGIVGTLLISLFCLIYFLLCIRSALMTYKATKNHDVFARFGAVKSSGGTRLGFFSPLFGCFVIAGFLIFGNCDFSVVFLTVFLLTGYSNAFRRCAIKEMNKAINAEDSDNNRHKAQTVISFGR